MRLHRHSVRRARNDRGAVAIVVALFVVIFMVLTAFVVDFGRQYAAGAQLQNAADAAALAGASRLDCRTSSPAGSAIAEAKDYASRNGVRDTAQTLAVTVPDVKRVTVVATEPALPTVFAKLIGVNSLYVSTRATASADCSVALPIFAQNSLQFNGQGTYGYSVWTGYGLTSSSASNSNPITFDDLFAVSPYTLSDYVFPNPPELRTFLTTMEFYALLRQSTPGLVDIDGSYPFPTQTAPAGPTPKFCTRSDVTSGYAANASTVEYWGNGGASGDRGRLQVALETAGATVYCRGALTGSNAIPMTNGNVVRANIFVSGDINFAGTGSAVAQGTMSYIYSHSGNISLDKVSAPDAIVLARGGPSPGTAPVGGNITVTSATNAQTLLCQEIGVTVTYNGGGQQVGCARRADIGVPTVSLTE